MQRKIYFIKSETTSILTPSGGTGTSKRPEPLAQRYLLVGIIRSKDRSWLENTSSILLPVCSIPVCSVSIWSLFVFASMLCPRQKRVWKYVKEGELLSLKSYLRKHRHLDVNFSKGRKQRSPLHLACYLCNDAVLRLLLKHGADVLRQDRKGDTPLHVAANIARKDGETGKRGGKESVRL